MASSFLPEQARGPPALQFPVPPVIKFKIELCQLKVTADKEKNILHARRAVEEAAEKGAKLVLLPEIWNSPYSNDSFPVYAEDFDAGLYESPSTAMLSEVSCLLNITIVGGSIPERSGDKLYNTCCVFGTDGKLKAKHRKLYVASCSPARDVGAEYVTWGHSTLVGPSGEVLATTEHEEAIIISDIAYSQIEPRRKNLPLEKKRQGDVYQLVDVQRLNS